MEAKLRQNVKEKLDLKNVLESKNNEFKEKKGSTTQTVLNHIDVILHHKDENIVNLFVRRSFAEHLWSWIKDCSSRL